ncbi:hypothetical protein PAMC26510_12335 [Caballeronia sordidicola]|uniref:HNH endonuclease n=1 Tax=Caballeronia sordidicola TaxID=196367 RepID=A0A242MX76_CABSO|nr:hypothetical protein PAMC26510_12335 [Caballeronia sordidicola]
MLEKHVYSDFSYRRQNLALSCSICNTAKNKRFAELKQTRSPSITLAHHAQFGMDGLFPADNTCYRWVHPHFHAYEQHVTILKGWVYRAKTPVGSQMIDDCEFRNLAKIEARNRLARLAMTKGPGLILAALAECNQARKLTVLRDVVDVLKKVKHKPI